MGKLAIRAPAKEELEPIETASRDALAALQLERLQSVAAPRLRPRAALPPQLRRRGRGARGCCGTSTTSPSSPSPPRTICAPTIPLACSPCRRSRSRGCMPPRARPASPPWSAIPRAISTPGPTWWRAASAPAAAAPGMKVHVAYGYGLFTGGLGAHYGAERLGCTVIPVSGGMTERQVRLIVDFEPDIIMVTPSYMLAILDEFRAQGLDPRRTSLKIGIFGAEPWTNAMRAEIEDALRHGRDRHLRPLRGDRPGRRQRMRRDQGRPACLGGSFLSGDHRSRDGRGRCPTASAANWSSPR